MAEVADKETGDPGASPAPSPTIKIAGAVTGPGLAVVDLAAPSVDSIGRSIVCTPPEEKAEPVMVRRVEKSIVIEEVYEYGCVVTTKRHRITGEQVLKIESMVSTLVLGVTVDTAIVQNVLRDQLTLKFSTRLGSRSQSRSHTPIREERYFENFLRRYCRTLNMLTISQKAGSGSSVSSCFLR